MEDYQVIEALHGQPKDYAGTRQDGFAAIDAYGKAHGMKRDYPEKKG